MSKISRKIVFDASVLRAAGDKPGISAHARAVLNCALEICHRANFSPSIQAEWDQHQSHRAVKWRSSMVARKKACLLSEEININAIESKIAALDGASPAETAALRKDAHLLAGAVQTDKLIVTADLRLATLTAKYLPELGIEFLCIDPSANEGARNKVLERLAELAHS